MLAVVEVRNWMSNFTPHETLGMITYPCHNFNLTVSVKGDSAILQLSVAALVLGHKQHNGKFS